MQDWVKQSFLFIGLSIGWDIIRTIIQVFLTSHFTRKLMTKDFKRIEEALDDVEEAIEEDNNDTNNT